MEPVWTLKLVVRLACSLFLSVTWDKLKPKPAQVEPWSRSICCSIPDPTLKWQYFKAAACSSVSTAALSTPRLCLSSLYHVLSSYIYISLSLVSICLVSSSPLFSVMMQLLFTHQGLRFYMESSRHSLAGSHLSIVFLIFFRASSIRLQPDSYWA